MKLKNYLSKLFGCDAHIWMGKYEEMRKESQHWEFKFNKLNKQIQAVIEEANK